MSNRFVSSVLVVFASTSMALAQTQNVPPYISLAEGPVSQGIVAQAGVPPQAGGAQAMPLSSGFPNGPGMSCADDLCLPTASVCGYPDRFWVNAEYLLWWMKGSPLPSLVTTGPSTSPTPGAIGSPGTGVLFGGGSVGQNFFSGGLFTAGFWLNDSQTIGIEAGYLFLGSSSENFTASSSGAPGSIVLARPFLDASTGLPNSELIAFPGLAGGSVQVHSSSGLQGAEANMIFNLCCSCGGCGDCCQPALGYRVDLLGGFRFLDLSDELNIAENIRVSPNSPVLPGENIRGFDQFNTRNLFYGGEIGIRAEVWQGRWFADITGGVALGTTQQTTDINGSTTLTPPVAGFGGRGDLLTGTSNIGHYSRNVFSVLPELGFNVGYQVTNNLGLYIGYTFLYWTNVTRPGDAIDLQVNSTRTPVSLVPPSGPAAPLFTFRSSDFWVQGINFGMRVRY
jgi:hypothetical protein